MSHSERMKRWRQGTGKYYQRNYRATPRGKFIDQRQNARRRGIEWLLTFDEWWQMWEAHWENRGRRKGNVCMCRHGDAGPYSMDNCFIGGFSENVSEAHKK